MTIFALSSGCFTNFEEKLGSSGVRAIELSSHKLKRLGSILKQVRDCDIQVPSVHCPCPSRGVGVNLGARQEFWPKSKETVIEAMRTAEVVGADYVVIHAFYCIDEELPSDDLERMDALRRLFPDSNSIEIYVKSTNYLEARKRAVHNLKSLIPHLRRDFPHQKIVLENLNPRTGYGGIRLSDVTAIVKEFGGDIGICLDIGHLTLSQEALGRSLEHEIEPAKDLIWTCHLHQNFGGAYALDRFWYENDSREPALQELDTHQPLTAKYVFDRSADSLDLLQDNSAFFRKFQGYVTYDNGQDKEEVPGCVPVERMLSHVPVSANRVLEFDSRFAPLEHILNEYALVDKGEHPIKLV